MSDPIPVPVPAGFEWFASFLSERMGRLEGMINSLRQELKSDFVMKHEVETIQEDVDRAHMKVRDLEGRVRSVELQLASDSGGDRVRWELVARVIGAVAVVVLAIVMAWLGLK